MIDMIGLIPSITFVICIIMLIFAYAFWEDNSEIAIPLALFAFLIALFIFGPISCIVSVKTAITFEKPKDVLFNENYVVAVSEQEEFITANKAIIINGVKAGKEVKIKRELHYNSYGFVTRPDTKTEISIGEYLEKKE